MSTNKFNIAKLLSTSDLTTISNNTIALITNGGLTDGISNVIYKSNDVYRRLLSPYEEFDSYWQYSNLNVEETEPVNILLNTDSDYKYVLIRNRLQPDFLNVYLPKVNLETMTIRYTYRIRLAVDENFSGFYLKVHNDDNNRIVGNRDTVLITAQNSVIDIRLFPNGIWYITGVFSKRNNGPLSNDSIVLPKLLLEPTDAEEWFYSLSYHDYMDGIRTITTEQPIKDSSAISCVNLVVENKLLNDPVDAESLFTSTAYYDYGERTITTN